LTYVQQRGYENVNSALKYALGQFPSLQNLGLSGSSAGALGVELNFDLLKKL
jgi:hypothetical protein